MKTHFQVKRVKLFFGNENVLVGIIRLFDMDNIADDDSAPLFDIRISKAFQGQGFGTIAVHWLTSYLFENWLRLKLLLGQTTIQ